MGKFNTAHSPVMNKHLIQEGEEIPSWLLHVIEAEDKCVPDGPHGSNGDFTVYVVYSLVTHCFDFRSILHYLAAES